MSLAKKATAKIYAHLFELSIHTAYKWLAQDKKALDKKIITLRDLIDRYGLHAEDLKLV